jgi:protein gp37
MSDIFEDRKTDASLGRILDVERERLFRMIVQTTSLDWLLLTKRPSNVLRMVPPEWRAGFPPNVWLGVTTENQENLERRAPALLACPARVHFLSYEPALDDLDLAPYLGGPGRVSWVIVGGESGAHARPMCLRRIERTIATCRDAGVAVFVKQLGSVPLAPGLARLRLRDRNGGQIDEWPESLRVREHPVPAA